MSLPLPTRVAIVVALAVAGAACAAPPRPAPPLQVEAVLAGPAPDALSWEALRWQAVVLEFWATWCFPCVEAIPHWNDLVERFAGEPVRFISISDEDEAAVRRFLEARPISGWVVLDADRSVFDAYGVSSIPRTVLIDARGRVRGVTWPESVTAQAVRDLIEGKEPGVPHVRDLQAEVAARLDAAAKPEPLFEALVRPSAGGNTLMVVGKDSFAAFNVPATMPLSFAYQVPSSRLVIEGDAPERS